jgi:hypothetical protein
MELTTKRLDLISAATVGDSNSQLILEKVCSYQRSRHNQDCQSQCGNLDSSPLQQISANLDTSFLGHCPNITTLVPHSVLIIFSYNEVG